MFWNAGGCDSADNIGSNKLNMAGMRQLVTKKLLKWEKTKQYFLFKADFVHFFCKKVNF